MSGPLDKGASSEFPHRCQDGVSKIRQSVWYALNNPGKICRVAYGCEDVRSHQSQCQNARIRKKCKLRNTNHFARRVQQNATDAFHQMVFQVHQWPPESAFQRNSLEGFFENLDIPLRRTAWLHAFVKGRAGSHRSKRSPTVMLPQAIINENVQL